MSLVKNFFISILFLFFIGIGIVNSAYTGTDYLKYSQSKSSCSFTKMSNFSISSDLIRNTDKTFGLGLFLKKGKIYNNDIYEIQLLDSQKSKNPFLILTGALTKDKLVYDLKIDLNKISNYSQDKIWFNIKFGNARKTTQACSFAVNYSSNSTKALDENELKTFYTGDNWNYNIGSYYSFYNCKNRFCFEKSLLISRNYDHRKLYGFNADKQSISFESSSTKTFDYLKKSLKKGSCILLIDQSGKGYSNKLHDFSIEDKSTYKSIYKFNLQIGASKDCGLNGQIKEDLVLKNANYKYFIKKVFYSGTGFKIGGSVLKLSSFENSDKKFDNKYFIVDDCLQTNYLKSIGTGGVVFVRPLKQTTDKSDYRIFDMNNYESYLYVMKNGNIFPNLKIKFNPKKCDKNFISNYFVQLYQDPYKIYFLYSQGGFNKNKVGKFGIVDNDQMYLSNIGVGQTIDSQLVNSNLNMIFIDQKSNSPIVYNGIVDGKAQFTKYSKILTLCGTQKDSDAICTKDNRLLDSNGFSSPSRAFVVQNSSGNYQVYKDFQPFPFLVNKIKTLKYLESGELVFVGSLLSGENTLFKFPNKYYKIGYSKLESIELLDKKVVVITENKIYKITDEMFNNLSGTNQDSLLNIESNQLSGEIMTGTLSGNLLTGVINTGIVVAKASSSKDFFCKIGTQVFTGLSFSKCESMQNEYEKSHSANLYTADISSGFGWFVGLILFLIVGGYLMIIRTHPNGHSLANFGFIGFINGILGLIVYKLENFNYSNLIRIDFYKSLGGKLSSFWIKLISSQKNKIKK